MQLTGIYSDTSKYDIYSYTGGIKKCMMPRPEYFAEALYTIDIGQNDLTAILFTSPNTSPDNYLQDALQRFATVIKVHLQSVPLKNSIISNWKLSL